MQNRGIKILQQNSCLNSTQTGGLCYERDEVLYQVLSFIGYEVYRIEASGFESKDHVSILNNDLFFLPHIANRTKTKTAPRYDHMAVGVHLGEEWYLCDIGWGGFMFEGAVKISSEG